MKKLSLFLLLTAFTLQGQDFTRLFRKQHKPFKGEPIVTNVQDLARVAQESADFLRKIHKSKYVTADVGLFKAYGVTLDQVRETLEFIAETGRTRPQLLSSPWFFNTHFTFYRWYGDKGKQPPTLPSGWQGPPECIRTTQYRITQISASTHKTAVHTYPLYEMPRDEITLTFEERKNRKDTLTRFQYPLSQILDDALKDNTLTKPLGWTDEKGYNEFAKQGSALLVFPDGQKKLLRVGGNNGFPEAEKYWYATEVAKRPKNSEFPVKVKPRADVTYAADMGLLGFGKVIALVCCNPKEKRMQTRLGVLVDTGSAFKGNLSKIDMFTGYFPDEDSFKEHIIPYPHTAQAYILIKKKEAPSHSRRKRFS